MRDYFYIHKDHTDWVSKVDYVPELGLVSSSLDSTIKVYDILAQKVTSTIRHHKKSVHNFVYCKDYGVVASCGLERNICVWNGITGGHGGCTTGHTIVGHSDLRHVSAGACLAGRGVMFPCLMSFAMRIRSRTIVCTMVNHSDLHMSTYKLLP